MHDKKDYIIDFIKREFVFKEFTNEELFSMYLEKEKFLGHNAETFTLNDIIDFAKVLEESGVEDGGIDLEVEGGFCCDVCDNYFYSVIDESVGYDSHKGFYIMDQENSDEEYSFVVQQCDCCGHWYTNIERI